MGDLTLSQLVAEVQQGLGNRTDAGVSTQRIVNVLNMAQKRIARKWPWKDLKQLLYAQMSYTNNPSADMLMSLPFNLRTVHSFVLLDTTAGLASMGQSHKMIQKPWRWFDNKYPAPAWLAPGWPQVYAWWGSFIMMAPPPQMQYTAQIRATLQPIPFSTTNLTAASIYSDKDDILINWSLGYLHRSYGRLDRAVYHENLVNELVNEAIDQDDRQPDLEVSKDLGELPSIVATSYWNNPFIMTQP
jgi:hypothetical protein